MLPPHPPTQGALSKFRADMIDLEEQVLDRLYRAPADILSDVDLIHGLEATKATAESLVDAVRTARGVEASLQAAREVVLCVCVSCVCRLLHPVHGMSSAG